jgi:hypothetical protein
VDFDFVVFEGKVINIEKKIPTKYYVFQKKCFQVFIGGFMVKS